MIKTVWNGLEVKNDHELKILEINCLYAKFMEKIDSNYCTMLEL